MARFLAFDIHDARVHLLAATVKNGVVRPEKALSWQEEQPLTPASAEAIGRNLRERLKEAGVAPAPLLACVGRERVILKELKFPPVPPAEEPALVRFQTVKELTEPAEQVVIDYCPVEEEGGGPERRALTVVLRKDVLRALEQVAEAAGLKLAGVTPRPFASAAALQQALRSGAVTAANGGGENGETSAVLVRGGGWGELTVARKGQVLFSRPLSGPSLSSEKALVGEVRRNLTVYAAQSPARPVQALYVAEADAPGGWSGRLQDGLPLPVQAFDPLAGSAAEGDPADRGHFACLVGLVFLRDRGQLPVNFLRPREPKPETDPNARLVVYAAVVMALVVAAAVVWGVLARSAREKTLIALNAHKNTLDRELGFLEQQDKRTQAVDDWERRRLNWLDELYDLAARFPDPARTRLTEFTGTPNERGRNGKSEYVAKLSLKLETNESRSVNELARALVEDKFYLTGPPLPQGGRTPSRSRFNQVYNLQVEIAPREPDQYVRVLDAKPPRGRDELAGDGEMPFGGGFGEFGEFGPGGFGGFGFGGDR
ncbi:MAG TPA: hypothetical protein VIL46_15905 [Gemmataceae bacterium]